MKKALITGINGQDGAYLAKLLLDKGYKVIGGDRRRSSMVENERLKILGIDKDLEIVDFDLSDSFNVSRVIGEGDFNEVYNLGAQSFVKSSFSNPFYTTDVNALGVLRLLEAIRSSSSTTRFYQASTSEMFGLVQEVPQNEGTPFYPRSPYGVSKLFSYWLVRNYRESFNLHASNGILFNHESELRGLNFVTKKIVKKAVEIYRGSNEVLYVGNINSERDWGHAEDYVYGMYLMLQHPTPDDYVLSTGVTTSIREFINLVFSALDIELDWVGSDLDEKALNRRNGRVVVAVSSEYFRPAEVDLLVGDSSKAHKVLNWKPILTLNDLIGRMISFELESLEKK